MIACWQWGHMILFHTFKLLHLPVAGFVNVDQDISEPWRCTLRFFIFKTVNHQHLSHQLQPAAHGGHSYAARVAYHFEKV
jgi:hypothetical protein